MTRTAKNTLETILVVDDQPLVREAVRGILEYAGFCVLLAGSGAEAIQTDSIEGTIHLLLSDVVMPDMSGPIVAHLLKKHRPKNARDADVWPFRSRHTVPERGLALHRETVPAGRVSQEGERSLAYFRMQPRRLGRRIALTSCCT